MGQLKLKVTSTGEVLYDTHKWGYAGHDGIMTCAGNLVKWSDMESFSMTSDDMLIANMSDGSATRIPPASSGYESSDFRITDDEVLTGLTFPQSLMTYSDIFSVIYPNCEECLYYDVLMEREMVDMAMFDRPEEGAVPMDDEILAMYHEDAERRMRAHGYDQGRVTARLNMDEALTIRLNRHDRNPFLEWVESHPWDGKPRVRTWFRNVFGAVADGLTPAEEEKYLGDVGEAWFIGAIARQFAPIVHDVVPVLIGEQGIGKGRGIRFTAGKEEWYKDTNIDISRPDRFLEGVRGRVIVELSEASQLRDKDAETMKSFISQATDQLRKPYARYSKDFPRHFVLIATSNNPLLFTDVTGNRRYFPMTCRPELGKSVTQEDVEQVWAEALAMYRDGKSYRLDNVAKMLASKMQDNASMENEGVATIDAWLNDPANGYDKVGAQVSRRIILRDFFRLDPSMPLTGDVKSAWRAWMIGTREWKRMPKTARIGGEVSRGFERIREAGEVAEKAMLPLTDESEDTLKARIAARFEKQGARDCGQVVDMSGFTLLEISECLREGYIYDTGASAVEHEYRLGVLRWPAGG